MSARCEVIHGDSIEVLRTREADSIAAVVTDAPYGLSDHSADDVTACLSAWLRGEEYRPRARGGFMGRAWDAWVPGPELWREVYRVMKPGAYLACFAGTRTADLMGIAIRLAGFRAIDTVHWLRGGGFPKSMNISKAIDRAAGAEREVIGAVAKLQSYGGGVNAVYGDGPNKGGVMEITAPATDAARDWEGWGTQLKPAVEPILVFQKPIAERTIAANVLAHGTGGLNIDACRAGVGGGGTRCTNRGEDGRCLGHGNAGRSTSGETFHGPDTTGGRFPANLVLSHAPGCREVGTREIAGDARDTGDRLGGSRPGGFADVGSEAGDTTPSGRVYGREVVTTYACQPGCPIAELDAQSGTRKSGTYRGLGYGGAEAREYPEVVGDEGAASHFFFQARLDEHGRFKYSAKASTRERSLGLPEGQRNLHSTVKPVALMRWLVRLMTPPGGVVLDPFVGSGTTGVAARLEGFGFVGVERDEDSHATARGRIEAWREYEEKPKKPSGARKAKAPAPSPAPAAIESKAEAPSSAERRRSQLSLFGDAA